MRHTKQKIPVALTAAGIFFLVNIPKPGVCDSFGKEETFPEYNSLSKASALKVHAALR